MSTHKKMKIIAVSGQKGGVGKTTLAVHLAGFFARRGLRVSLIDRDPQLAADGWHNGGPGLPFPVIADLKAPLSGIVSARAGLGDDVCIIDTAPSIGGAFRDLPGTADFAVLPFRPSVLDARALVSAIEAMGGRIPYAAVVSQVNPREKLTAETSDAIGEAGVIVAVSTIAARTAYRRAAVEGRTAFELGKAGEPAAEEIIKLGEEIAQKVGIKLAAKR